MNAGLWRNADLVARVWHNLLPPGLDKVLVTIEITAAIQLSEDLTVSQITRFCS
jgi:hypothetical protein